MIVVDTNIVAYLLLRGTHTEMARQVFLRNSNWAAPSLWRSEFRNVLSRYVQQKHIALAHAIELQTVAEELFAGREYAVNSIAILETAAASECSAYDCEFVTLARTLGVPLVTNDQQVLRAFPGIAASPKDFLQ